MKKIEIEIPDGKKAEWVNGVLTLVDEKPKDITERVKTFGDACKELGGAHPFVESYFRCESLASRDDSCDTDVIAYLKLRIICAALNEGWQPKLTEDEHRYCPWFVMPSKTEIENMSENEKEKLSMIDAGGYYIVIKHAGVVPLYARVNVVSHLCLKTEQLAEYCGRQFIDIWADYLLRRK